MEPGEIVGAQTEVCATETVFEYSVVKEQALRSFGQPVDWRRGAGAAEQRRPASLRAIQLNQQQAPRQAGRSNYTIAYVSNDRNLGVRAKW